jgi:hypothetical protein
MKINKEEWRKMMKSVSLADLHERQDKRDLYSPIDQADPPPKKHKENLTQDIEKAIWLLQRCLGNLKDE